MTALQGLHGYQEEQLEGIQVIFRRSGKFHGPEEIQQPHHLM